MEAAKLAGTRISYDLNYRESLWKRKGGRRRRTRSIAPLLPFVDVLFGNEEDFVAALGYEIDGNDGNYRHLDTSQFRKMILEARVRVPQRADRGDHASYRGVCVGERVGGDHVPPRRVLRGSAERHSHPRPSRGGDSFAAGVIYGLLESKKPQWCVECGVAHGALAMSTRGDTTMASLSEVLRLMKGESARIQR